MLTRKNNKGISKHWGYKNQWRLLEFEEVFTQEHVDD